MSMDVQKEPQVLNMLFHVALDQVHLKTLIISLPPKTPIHVFALQISAIIPDDHPIWIHHRQDPPGILVAQGMRLWVIRQ